MRSRVVSVRCCFQQATFLIFFAVACVLYVGGGCINSGASEALATLARNADIIRLADGSDAVALLWDVCRIPDFRKVMSDAHAHLLGLIYRHLAGSQSRLPADWLADQVARIDRTDGDTYTRQEFIDQYGVTAEWDAAGLDRGGGRGPRRRRHRGRGGVGARERLRARVQRRPRRRCPRRRPRSRRSQRRRSRTQSVAVKGGSTGLVIASTTTTTTPATRPHAQE